MREVLNLHDSELKPFINVRYALTRWNYFIYIYYYTNFNALNICYPSLI